MLSSSRSAQDGRVRHASAQVVSISTGLRLDKYWERTRSYFTFRFDEIPQSVVLSVSCSTSSLSSVATLRVASNTLCIETQYHTFSIRGGRTSAVVELGKFDPPLWHVPYGRIV